LLNSELSLSQRLKKLIAPFEDQMLPVLKRRMTGGVLVLAANAVLVVAANAIARLIY
jgi:hypothetical protein